MSSTVSISSVAYATEESASLANTASAVLLPSRSCISWSVRIFRPTSMLAMSIRRRAPWADGAVAPSSRWWVPRSGAGGAGDPGAGAGVGSRLGSVTVVAMCPSSSARRQDTVSALP